MGPPGEDVTRLLKAWNDGSREALDELVPAVYSELRRLARSALRHERPGHTLQTTALVNEAYLRMVDQRKVSWRDRAHFFGAASEIMRRILVDHARKHRAGKRGAGATMVTLDEALAAAEQRDIDVLALDLALDTLAAVDPRQSELVVLRFFGGLNIKEAAHVLKISPATVSREWSTAKMWLRKELSPA